MGDALHEAMVHSHEDLQVIDRLLIYLDESIARGTEVVYQPHEHELILRALGIYKRKVEEISKINPLNLMEGG